MRFLKFAVPATAVVGAGLFVVLAWFNPFRLPNIVVEGSPVIASDGTLDVKLPHLTGTNNRGQKYDVTATSGAQRVTAPGVVALTDLNAVIAGTDQSNATLTAATGKFDSNTQILSPCATMSTSSRPGLYALLRSGTIDFKGNTVHSDEPVTVNLSNGTILANNLDIVEGGSKITFAGGVTANFTTPLGPDGGDDADVDDAATDDVNATGSTPPDPANPAQGSPAQ